jgi:hypothetical protein
MQLGIQARDLGEHLRALAFAFELILGALPGRSPDLSHGRLGWLGQGLDPRG